MQAAILEYHGPARREHPSSHAARAAPPRDQPEIGAAGLLTLAAAGVLVAVAIGRSAPRTRHPRRPVRRAGLGAGMVAASVLLDSAMEHHRGNFANRAMYLAPAVAGLTLAAGVASAASEAGRPVRGAIFCTAVATGLLGTGFHCKNILERPGGLTFNNLFYRAPFGAPAALAVAGALGLGALAVGVPGAVGDRRAGRLLGTITAASLFGLTAEIGLLHFRGAFHNPLMYAPVICVPATGVAVLAAVLRPGGATVGSAQAALGVTATLGLLGTGLHAYGVSRNSGGFGNWTQNLFQGPPIAAPPSLAGIALGGLAALELLASAVTKGNSRD